MYRPRVIKAAGQIHLLPLLVNIIYEKCEANDEGRYTTCTILSSIPHYLRRGQSCQFSTKCACPHFNLYRRGLSELLYEQKDLHNKMPSL